MKSRVVNHTGITCASSFTSSTCVTVQGGHLLLLLLLLWWVSDEVGDVAALSRYLCQLKESTDVSEIQTPILSTDESYRSLFSALFILLIQIRTRFEDLSELEF